MIGEVSHENGFAGKGPFTNIQKLTEKPLVWLGTIPHFCLKGNMVIHVVHRACLCDYGFARVKLHLDNLHIISNKFVIYFVTFHG